MPLFLFCVLCFSLFLKFPITQNASLLHLAIEPKMSLLLVPLSHCGFWWFNGPIGFSVVYALVAMVIWQFDLIFSIYSSWVRLSGWWWLVFLFFSFLFPASGGGAVVGLSLWFGFGFVICLWFWWLGVKVVGGGDNGYGGGWVIGCWVSFVASGLWLVVGGVFIFFPFFSFNGGG